MSNDAYLQQILNREAVDTSILSPVRGVQTVIEPVIRQWAGNYLIGLNPSGSFAKGTANRSGTDIDLFVSLSDTTPNTLKEIYDTLFNAVKGHGYTPKRQNVSINVSVSGYDVDLVPAKRQNGYGSDHSLYRRRADTWTKTNVTTHINHVIGGGLQRETRILKLWRNQKGLDFPSFYLELIVINALSHQVIGTLSGNIVKVFEYLRDSFENARIVDPANTNNVISDDLTAADKTKIKAAATQALSSSSWTQVVA